MKRALSILVPLLLATSLTQAQRIGKGTATPPDSIRLVIPDPYTEPSLSPKPPAAPAGGFPSMPVPSRPPVEHQVEKPKPAALTKRKEVTIDFVWFSGSQGNARGGASPMTVRIEPNPSRQPSVGVLEEFASGLGDMWKTATWIAAINATSANRQYVNDHEFLVRVGGRVDGPSAGMLMTVAMLAALRGDELPPGTTMTGTINPDGTCGPVGGIPQKMSGAKAKGYERFGFPVGLRMAVDMQTGQKVDLMQVGRTVGLKEVKEIGTLEEAYLFFTGKPLDQEKSASSKDMALSAQYQREVTSRITSLWAQVETRTPRLELKIRRSPREMQAALLPMIQMFSEAEQQKGAFESSGWPAAALYKTIEADILLRFLELQIDFMQPLYKGDLEAAATQVKALSTIRKSVEAFANEAGNLSRRRTVGGRLNAIEAMGNYAHALTRVRIGDSNLANFQAYYKALLEGKVKRSDTTAVTEAMLVELNTALLNYALAEVLVDYSRELISMGVEEGPMAAEDLSTLQPFGRAFSSAGAAALSYFDSIVVKPQADAAKVTMDQARAAISQQEMMYPVIQFSSQVAVAAPKLFPRPHEQALFQLALGNQTYLSASSLVNKYYGLGASTDAQGELKLGNRRMLTLQLETARKQSLKMAARCQQALGFIPSTAKMSFQIATALREGDDEDKLIALESFWTATRYCEMALLLGR